MTYLKLLNIHKLSDQELVSLFQNISPNVSELDLSYSHLNLINIEHLTQALKALPQTVVNFNLSHNHFDEKTSDELITILKAIPETVNELNISFNDLGAFPPEELALIIAAIPAGVTSLNISFNGLGFLQDQQTIVLAAIPKNVSKINLSGNSLDNTDKRLIKTIKALPKTVTSLITTNQEELSLNNYHTPLNIDLDAVLKIIEETSKLSQGYQNSEMQQVYNAAKTLREDLEEAQYQFLISSISITSNEAASAFKKACREAINKSHMGLQNHNLQRMLVNLERAIDSLRIRHRLNLNSPFAPSLVEIFQTIPTETTDLDLSLNGLGFRDTEDLIKAIQIIPKAVTNLNLSQCGIAQKASAEFVKILKAIPETVTKLNLSGNLLKKFLTPEELAQIFAAIPAGVTSLDLSQNALGELSEEELAKALAALPKNVTTINLSGNFLDNKAAQLIINALPKTVTSFAIENDVWLSAKNYHSPLDIDFTHLFEGNLKFCEKYQNDESYRHICTAARTLQEDLEIARLQFFLNTTPPEAIKETEPAFKMACREAINKSKNELQQHYVWQKTLADLEDAIGYYRLKINLLSNQLSQSFKTIPAGTTYLNLSGNGLGVKDTDGLVEALQLIPESVAKLNLRWNLFDHKPSTDLVKILKAIPKTVTELDLGGNFLWHFIIEELVQIFAAIPAGVTTLDLSTNRPFSLTDKQLSQVLAALPKNITRLNLSDIINDKTYLSKVINALPKTVTSFAFESDEWLSVNNYHFPLNIDFDAHLKLIEEKIKFYEKYQSDKNYHSAYQAAKTLYDELEAARCKFLLSTTNPEVMKKSGPAFQKACLDAIDRSRSVLEKHRGWKEVLANLASAIISVVSFGIANYATGRNMFGLFPTKTDAAKKLDDLTNALGEAPNKATP